MQKHIITLLCAAGMIISAPAMAERLRVKPNAPKRYTVKPGDTLWGISGKYLYRPYKWPKLWRANRSKIANPHRIYPGQVLVLSYVNGRPVLRVQGGGKRVRGGSGGIPIVKLSPRVRDLGSGYGIPTLNVDFYRLWMRHPQFYTSRELVNVARIVGGPDNRVMYADNDRIYADGIQGDGTYLVFRVNRDLIDPVTRRNLGKLVEFSGEAHTLGYSNSAHEQRSAAAAQNLGSDEYYAKLNGKSVAVHTAQPMILSNVVSEIRRGDYLIRKPEDMDAFNMMPHEPAGHIDARIVYIMDGIAESGMGQTLILNKGAADGLDKGTVLSIYKPGRIIKSDYHGSEARGNKTRYVNTPVEEIGLAMIYRTDDHVSSAIILESKSNVNSEYLLGEPGRDLDTFGPSGRGRDSGVLEMKPLKQEKVRW